MSSSIQTSEKGRNIIMCFDGTGDWVATHQTNVFKIYDLLDKSDPDKQICFYSGGVGTLSNAAELSGFRRTYLKILDLATATSLHEKTLEGYRFLVENYRPGDNIYLIGFSRGAFTARLLAAMIYRFGILEKTNAHLVPYFWESISMVKDIVAFKGESTKQKERFSQPGSDQVKFLGLFDTVSSIGVFERFKIFPYTDRNPNVEVVRHAIAKDETRNAFPELLITPDGNDVVELWFDGVHRDIGGGGKGNQTISKHTLSWMAKSGHKAGMIFKEPPPEPPQVTPSGENAWVVHQPTFDPYALVGLYPMHMYDFSLKRRVIGAIYKLGEKFKSGRGLSKLIYRWFFRKDPGFRYLWPNFKHRRVPPHNALFYDPQEQAIQKGQTSAKDSLLTADLSEKPVYYESEYRTNPALEFLATMLGSGLALLVLNRGLIISRETVPEFLLGKSWPSLNLPIPLLKETGFVCSLALVAYMLLQALTQKWQGKSREVSFVTVGVIALSAYLIYAASTTPWPALGPAALFALLVATIANIRIGKFKYPKLPADRAIATFIVPWSILICCAWAANKILPLAIIAINRLFDGTLANINPDTVNRIAWIFAAILGITSLTKIVLDRIKRAPEPHQEQSSQSPLETTTKVETADENANQSTKA